MTMGPWARAGIVAVGVVVVLVGLMWRSLEANWGHQLDYPFEVVAGVNEDGNWTAMHVEGDRTVEVLFEGTQEEYDAWVADHEVGADMRGPTITMVVGAGVVVLGLVAGRSRRAGRHDRVASVS